MLCSCFGVFVVLFFLVYFFSPEEVSLYGT